MIFPLKERKLVIQTSKSPNFVSNYNVGELIVTQQ